MTQHQLDSFPQFSELPNELKDLIWESALEQRPAVHFVCDPRFDGTDEAVEAAASRRPRRLRKAAPPADIPPNPHLTQQETLLRTCQASREVVLRRQRSWAPERTIQLYEVNENPDRAVPNDVQGDNAGPITRGQRQIERQQTLNGENNLFILDNWEETRYNPGVCQQPIIKVGYLACLWTGSSNELSLDQFIAFLYRPPICEVLYVVVNPDDLELDSAAEPSEAEVPQQDVTGSRWSISTGTQCPVPRTPGRFWHGKREYYQISWNTVKRVRASNLDSLCFLLGNPGMWTKWRRQGCKSCGAPSCNFSDNRWPVAYKALTWRDWD